MYRLLCVILISLSTSVICGTSCVIRNFFAFILENQIDGEVLECLTERALESLIPVVGLRMKFLKLLKTTKESPVNIETNSDADKSPGPTNVETQENVCETPVVGGESSMNSRFVLQNTFHISSDL